MTITLEDMRTNKTDVNVETMMEIINDLWDAFNKMHHADVATQGMINDYDVERFQNWAKTNDYDTIDKYLPKSTTQLAEIIRYCENRKMVLA